MTDFETQPIANLQVLLVEEERRLIELRAANLARSGFIMDAVRQCLDQAVAHASDSFAVRGPKGEIILAWLTTAPLRLPRSA